MQELRIRLFVMHDWHILMEMLVEAMLPKQPLISRTLHSVLEVCSHELVLR